MKKGVFGAGAVIGLTIAVIMIISVVLPIVTQQTTTYGQLTQVVNESVNATNSSYKTLANYPVGLGTGTTPGTNGVPYFRNESGNANLTYGTHYSWQATDATRNQGNGTVYFFNIPATWNMSCCVGINGGAACVCGDMRISYGYATQNYQMVGAAGNTIVNMLPLFVILIALVGIASAMGFGKK